MPLYDYECRACGDLFEAIARAGRTVACPACGSEELERRITSPATVAKFRLNRAKAVPLPGPRKPPPGLKGFK